MKTVEQIKRENVADLNRTNEPTDDVVSIDTESAIFQFKGTAAENHSVKVLGLRGFFSNENKMGIYDDMICSVIDGKVTAFRASTDPGSYWIQHPMKAEGCARLKLGLWKFALGMHLNAHPALVQAEPFTVDRLSSQGDIRFADTGHFGINLHSGGEEYAVGRYSAGCQVIQCPGGAWGMKWQEFFIPVRDAMKARGLETCCYLLIENPKAKPA